MTQLFVEMRNYGFAAVLILSATVLGIAAYLGSIFLPDLNRDFTIFAIVVPSLTMLAFIALYSWSRPYTDGIVLFILGVLWLALASWDSDITSGVQCDGLGNARTATKNGSVSSKSVCYEMKVIEAFSWILFALLTMFLWILISLTTRAKAMGRTYAWSEPIVELPWFGQYPGMPAGYYGSQGYAYPAGAPYPSAQPMYPQTSGGYVVQQQPGHSIIIRPGQGVTQVPGMVTSV